jgi:hypothetical protein
MSSTNDDLALWSGLLAEQKASGLTIADWCREKNLSVHAFSRQRNRINKKSASGPAWISVKGDEGSPPASPICLRIGSVWIDLSSGFDPKLLREVVAALEARC